jgi:hypothetical protein
MMRIWIVFILLCADVFAVNFVNDDTTRSNSSKALKEIAWTLREITKNAFTKLGEDYLIKAPYSNQSDNVPVINVFLYDIKDGGNSVNNTYKSYFMALDQIRTAGNSNINLFSNKGNVIYMDINPLDPTKSPVAAPSVGNSSVSTDHIFGDKRAFYAAYSESLMRLLNFQYANDYVRGNGKETATEIQSRMSIGRYFSDYNWVAASLGSFASFWFTRTGRSEAFLGYEPGLRLCTDGVYIGCDSTKPVFNTTYPAIYPTRYLDSDYLYTRDVSYAFPPYVPYQVIKFLHYSEKENGLNTPLPSLFYRDYIYDNADASRDKYEVSQGMGHVLLQYIWEQLENDQKGKGDTFIKKMMKGWLFTDNLYRADLTKLYTGTQCDLSYAPNDAAHPPVDKICELNRILTHSSVGISSTRTFGDFFMDMASAAFWDSPYGNDPDFRDGSTNSALSKFELRNIDFSRQNAYDNVQNSSFKTGSHSAGMNFVRVMSVEDFKSADSTAQTTGSSSVVASVRSTTPFRLTTYSYAYVQIKNNNANSEMRYPYLDAKDVLDNNVSDRSTTSLLSQVNIKEQRVNCQAALSGVSNICGRNGESQYGYGYFVLPEAQSAEIESTGVAIYQGLSETGVLYEKPRVNFSQQKTTLVREQPVTASDRRMDVYELMDSWKDYFVQDAIRSQERRAVNYSINSVSRASSGVKTYNSYSPIHQIRGNQLWENDPTAFRQYTHSFQTLDFVNSSNTQMIMEQRTAILKEVVGGPENTNPRWKINLWVDQLSLPDDDSLSSTSPTTPDTGVEPPPEPGEEQKPETKTLNVDLVKFSSGAATTVQTSYAISGLKYSTGLDFSASK